MTTDRLKEVCLEIKNAGVGRKMSALCASLVKELKLSAESIESTFVEGPEGEDDFVTLRKKIIKAVTSEIRKRVFEVASKRGLVSLGSPLPKIGFWHGKSVFIETGPTGMFNLKHEDGKVSHTDPLRNPEFINLIFK